MVKSGSDGKPRGRRTSTRCEQEVRPSRRRRAAIVEDEKIAVRTRIKAMARTQQNRHKGTGENARTVRRRIKAHHEGEEQGG